MAFTYAGQYGTESFIDPSGVPLRNCAITVYLRGTTTKAALYTDRARGAVASNPFLTDGNGNGSFYADPGLYDLNANGMTIPVVVDEDPAEPEATVDLSPYELVARKGQANGYPGLDANAKLNPAVLPPLAINDTFVVTSEAAMLALVAQRGDVAVRTDLSPRRVFMLTTDDPTALGNWIDITYDTPRSLGEVDPNVAWNSLTTANQKVHAHYYAWYGNPSVDGVWQHWNAHGHTPPDDIASSFYPALGTYSPSDATVLAQHMAQIRACGIGVIVLDWWGTPTRAPLSEATPTRVRAVFDAAYAQGIKVTFMIDSGNGAYAGGVARTPATICNLVDGDIKYLIDTYGSHPAFYRVARNTKYGASSAARPMFYVWQSTPPAADATVYNSAAWQAALDPLHASSTYNSIVLGHGTDHITGGVNTDIDTYHYDGCFIYGGEPDYGANYGSHKSALDAVNSICMFSVSPGTDTTRVGSYTPTIPRYNFGGSVANPPSTAYTYDRMWHQVTSFESFLLPGQSAEFVAITTFNEWHEGTMLEPAVPKTITGFTYQDFDTTPGGHPFLYLNKTATNIRTFLNVPSPTGDVIVQTPAQAFQATPVDQSAAVQAEIDALYVKGGGVLRFPSGGVWYGSFKMRPHVSIVGSGFDTVLRALPAQSASILDYHTYDAFHVKLSNLRVEGNYRLGSATCRGIDMTSSIDPSGFSFTIPNSNLSPNRDYGVNTATDQPTTWGDYWDITNNRVEDVMVLDCGGDAGVILGIKQANTRTRGLTIQQCAHIGFLLNCTDTIHAELDVGNCGDGIVVRNAANKIINFKSWYNGRNTGYKAGLGDGIRYEGQADGAVGDCTFIGETNDNARYGWVLRTGAGTYCRGNSAGDALGCILLGVDGQAGNGPAYNNLEIVHSKADRPGPSWGVIIGNGAAYNRVRLSVDPNNVGAGWTAAAKVNSGTLNTQDIVVGHGALDGSSSWVDVGTVTGTYTPTPGYAETTKLNVATAVTIAPPTPTGYRRRIRFVIEIFTGGSITWDASWVNAPAVPTTPGKYSVEFTNYGYLSSVSPSWQHHVQL